MHQKLTQFRLSLTILVLYSDLTAPKTSLLLLPWETLEVWLFHHSCQFSSEKTSQLSRQSTLFLMLLLFQCAVWLHPSVVVSLLINSRRIVTGQKHSYVWVDVLCLSHLLLLEHSKLVTSIFQFCAMPSRFWYQELTPAQPLPWSRTPHHSLNKVTSSQSTSSVSLSLRPFPQLSSVIWPTPWDASLTQPCMVHSSPASSL